jgi:hypothetical protein
MSSANGVFVFPWPFFSVWDCSSLDSAAFAPKSARASKISAEKLVTGEAKLLTAYFSSTYCSLSRGKYAIKPERIFLLELSLIERLLPPTAVWFTGRFGQ